MDIVWKQDFCVGIEDIDSQHKYFFKIIKKIEEVLKNEDLDLFLDKVSPELLRYAKYHFACEEQMMEIYNSGELFKQKEEHSKLINELNEQLEYVKHGSVKPEKLLDFLYRWFSSHTSHKDQIYAEEIKKIRDDAI